MDETNASVTPPSADWTARQRWSAIDWRNVEQWVFRQQKRIYKAECHGNVKAVQSIQRLILRSEAARLLAVRRVTQDNQGKRTAGIDGVKAVRAEDRFQLVEQLKDLEAIKARPVRRVLIPKRGKPGARRPLGIPVMLDRAHQALVKLALEPQWEARFEPNSYGFRPGRSAHDALEAIFNMIREQPKYALDADIQGCFDHISHAALVTKVDAPRVIRRAIKAWLKAGVMDGPLLHPTECGTPQGGVISPLLANIALHGLEQVITASYQRRYYYPNGNSRLIKAMLVRYADDFVVLCQDREGIEAARIAAERFLADMGLHLNAHKTRITHTLDDQEGSHGFDFLGVTIRQDPVGKCHSGKRSNGEQLGFKTRMNPSKEAVKQHVRQLGKIIDAHRGHEQGKLIGELNPVITGWARYYAPISASRAFAACDTILYRQLASWARRRHPNKGKKWLARRYWSQTPRWQFRTATGLCLRAHTDIPTGQHHAKVRGAASPYDGNLVYWARRLKEHPLMRTTTSKLLARQQGRCRECTLLFRDGDLLEQDHIIPGGGDRLPNLQLLHRHCHDRKTVRMGDHRHRNGVQ